MTTPACMHCGEAFEQHVVCDDDRWCRDGMHTFNCVFHVNPEVIDFLREHPDKSPEELTAMWIDRVTTRKP